MSKFHIVLESTLCLVCGDHPETHSHLFFSCCLSQRVVELVFTWLGFRGWPMDFNGWLSWLSVPAKGIVNMVSVAAIAATCYSLWLNRNRCVFEGHSKSDVKLAHDIKSVLSYRLYIPAASS
ncbi:uncharacterized protein LOC133805536 [Humulus lupulus]|uniref:uncharacterized protein LOC133805536 n=1 Tax=Humulus lupulus TaxID=3486 RepID=UPI002B40AD46|nr:uncharacterized protein LOC133805536 [Humulus lupulus]